MHLFYGDQSNFNPLPRKEGDFFMHLFYGDQSNFNPLPRKEGDACRFSWEPICQFQSTPS